MGYPDAMCFHHLLRVLVCAAGLPATGGCATLGTQFTRAAAEIRNDLKILNPDDDGLDAFDARTAREIRSMRAELEQ
jgi:hypothetical protein